MSDARRREQLCQLLRSYASGYDALHKDIAADFREAAELLLSRPTPPDRVSLAGTEVGKLVEQLRAVKAWASIVDTRWHEVPFDATLFTEAAAALAGLAGENARLRSALDGLVHFVEDASPYELENPHKYARFIDARAALQEPPDHE